MQVLLLNPSTFIYILSMGFRHEKPRGALLEGGNMRKQFICLMFSLLVSAIGRSCYAEGYDFSEYMPAPGEHDHYMVFHIKPMAMENPTYQKTVFFVASLLSKSRGVIPGSRGYYLSRSKYSPDGVRLTVFLKGMDSGQLASKWVTALSNDKIIKITPYVSLLDEESTMTKFYEGDEQAFRKYLSLYTPIMIECMQYDFNKTQNEIKSLMDNGGMDIELLENSKYFMSLTYNTRTEFIRDLYFNRKWTHMVINFVLGYDED
jgi:hypothetical protein